MNDIVTVVSIVGGIGAGCFIWYAIIRMHVRHRELLHTERMAAIEKGFPPLAEPHSAQTPPPPNSLKKGLFWLSVGISVMLAVRIADPGSGQWAWGIVLTGVGLSSLVYWFARGQAECRDASECSAHRPSRPPSDSRDARNE